MSQENRGERKVREGLVVSDKMEHGLAAPRACSLRPCARRGSMQP